MPKSAVVGDNSGAEEVVPDAVHHDAGSEGVFGVGEPIREFFRRTGSSVLESSPRFPSMMAKPAGGTSSRGFSGLPRWRTLVGPG